MKKILILISLLLISCSNSRGSLVECCYHETSLCNGCLSFKNEVEKYPNKYIYVTNFSVTIPSGDLHHHGLYYVR